MRSLHRATLSVLAIATASLAVHAAGKPHEGNERSMLGILIGARAMERDNR